MNTGVALSHITKRFPGVVALSDVSLTILPGEVHALMGENGAGKSTLMKVLCGVFPPDEGTILLDGKPMRMENPLQAIERGITFIHQELNPIHDMTVAENIYLRREPAGKLGMVNTRKLYSQTEELFERIGIREISPRSMMRELSVAKKQLVEIAKAVSFHSRFLIMDEPTSAISDRDVENLFALVRMFREKGVGIVYISHKMDEILQISDRVSVMRDGRMIATQPAAALNKQQLISMMVDRELGEDLFPPKETADSAANDVALEVRALSSESVFQDISFVVRKGEVLGIAGLVGAGRTELVESIFGLRRITGGTVYVAGKPVAIRHPKDAIACGIALVPEDRKSVGLNLVASVVENLTLPSLSDYLKRRFVSNGKQAAAAQSQVEFLSIKTPYLSQLTRYLSGGNQQKTVIGKWLLKNSDVLILDEPTRGIDVGTKREVYELIRRFAQSGKAIVMISSELPEILGMSDRVLVMHEGRATAMLPSEGLSQERIMHFAMLNEGERHDENYGA